MGVSQTKYVTPKYATDYIRRGMSCIPIPLGSKNPNFEGWQKLRLTEDQVPRYFDDKEMNVGIRLGEPSGDVVDVDMDVPEARKIADRFLPPTVTSGREGSPRSHSWYQSPGSKTKKWQDIGSQMLLELRSTGCQTLVEPSIHPSGERYMWDRSSGFRMASLEAEQLHGMCRELATATLIARHLPPIGGRHDYALPLAGYLLRSGRLDGETTLKILLAAWHAADGDSGEAVKDLEGIVRDTARKLDAGEQVKGAPSLDEMVPGMVEVLAKWWGWGREQQQHGAFPDAPFSDNTPWPELSDAAYCGLAGDIVKFIEPETEADPVALLANVMAAFGNSVGRGAYFRVGADIHYPKVFAALVGETAKGRKGMSWGHVKMLMEQADPKWAEHSIANGLSSGEGLIQKLQNLKDHVEFEDFTNRVLAEETLAEGEANKAVKVSRLLVMEPELANVLKVIKREGNTLSPVIREAWDTGALQTLTKNSPMKVNGSHVSVIGHITKTELTSHLTETEMANGLANRFLYFLVTRSKLLPFGGYLRKEDMAPLANRLARAISFGKTAGEIGWSDNAKEVWVDVYGNLSEGRPGLFGAVTSRAEAQVVRLAIIYAVMDSSKIIERGHLEAALALWRYSEQSARYIFGNSTGDPVADRILTALKEAGSEGMTRTQIRDLFKRNKDARTIERALTLLERLGRACKETRDTGGKPEERWFYVS